MSDTVTSCATQTCYRRTSTKGTEMTPKLTLRYDKIGDILYIDRCLDLTRFDGQPR